MTTEFFILTRAVHFASCLLFFGIFAFDRFIATSIFSNGQSEITVFWKTRLKIFSSVLLPVIFLSGLAWFALVAITMSGQSLSIEILKTVWTQTQFGTVWKIRLIFWFAVTITFILFNFSKSLNALENFLIWLQFIFGGCLLGGLAWAGHGRENSNWHLSADVLHLLVAGFWPTGLLPLILLLKKLRQISGTVSANLIAALVRRFSAMSLVGVVLLAATGLVNSWFLVGSVSNLFGQTYGRWLLVKIVLFCVAAGIGAINLLKLKPRLSERNPRIFETASAQLRFNVRLELFWAMAIVIVVAVLGILPPANR